MTIVTRKEREKTEMRQQILNAARHLFLEQGFEKTSIRNIAEQIEYSAGTIYLYFKDKNEILFTLHCDSFEALMAAMQVGLQNEPSAIKRLELLGKNYLKYAFENPELYDLMFIMRAPIEVIDCRSDVWREGQTAFNYLQLVVKDCIEEGYFPGKDVESISLMMWSMVHGLASLKLKNRTMIFEEEKLPTLLEETHQTFIEIIKTYRK